MSGKIYMINQDETLSELVETPYASEDLLQELLEKYPDLLAGEQVNPDEPRRWLFISREVAVPGEDRSNESGYLDHLFLDQDGIPTLIEVKRSSDSRIRRAVVGQMLDYAANAVAYWSVEGIQNSFEKTCERKNDDPMSLVLELLNLEDIEDEKINDFWQQVKTNLLAGRIRLVFVADVIPTSLKQVVEFLNGQMDPAEVVAVEVKQYIGDNIKTLVPRVIGHVIEAQKKSLRAQGNNKKWNPETFYPELEKKHSIKEVKVAKAIEEWAEKNVSHVWWGEGSVSGSFVPQYFHKDTKHQLFAVYTYGTVELYFYWYKFKTPFDNEDKRIELLKKINSIEGIDLPESSINKRPNISLSIFEDPKKLEKFIEIFDWVIEEIKKS
jgi:hypothetical protein